MKNIPTERRKVYEMYPILLYNQMKDQLRNITSFFLEIH